MVKKEYHNMNRLHFYLFFLISCMVSTSCKNPFGNKKDARFLASNLDTYKNIDLEGFEIPTVYNLNGEFAPGAYQGQTRRLAQLQEIVDSSRNEPILWDIANALKVGGLESIFSNPDAQNTTTSSSDLLSKIDELNYDNGNTTEADAFYDLANRFVESSQAHYTKTASNGEAGMITSGAKKRHVNENGLEFIQIIEKGLYGAIFYDQMVDDYLRSSQSGPDNPKGNNQSAVSDYEVNGTDRQHRWDEAFGYLGANPLTYPNTTNDSNGDGKFLANYMFDFSDEIEEVYGINIAQKTMDAYIFGRSVLKAGEGFGPEQETTNEEALDAAIQDIKLYVEASIAASAFHYLNAAISDLTNEDKIHHLSEALAFIYALSYNSEGRISFNEVVEVLRALGWSSTDNSLSGIYEINLWEVSDSQMEDAKNKLDVAFPGFADVPF